MSWAEIKKSINSNLSKTLDVFINEKHEYTNAVVSWEAGSTKDLVTQKHANTDALIHDVHNVMSVKMDDHLDYIANNATHGLIALLNAINSIKTGGSVKVIKSVQRGISEETLTPSSNPQGVTIQLTTIDPSKTIVFINFSYFQNHNNASMIPGFRYTLSANSLYVPWHSTVVEGMSTNYKIPAFSWQVIEFY